jgi:hypothetical protein
MVADVEAFKLRLRRWILIIGMAQVLFGCLVGFIPPTAVPWFRGVVMAHIEFTANGVLMTVVGLLTPELRLPRLLLHLWFWTLLIGTWANGSAGVVAAFTGRSTQLLPTANQGFPPPHGADNPLATALLLVTGFAIVVALLLTLAGLIRSRNTIAA